MLELLGLRNCRASLWWRDRSLLMQIIVFLGNDVLMVVSNQQNGNGDKPILAYEVAQEAMLAYANQQFANVGIVGIAQEDGTIVQQHNG